LVVKALKYTDKIQDNIKIKTTRCRMVFVSYWFLDAGS